jgi:hypothetical protein
MVSQRRLRSAPADPQIKAELSAYCAYSVNREYRVLFRFLGPSEVLYYDVGTHENLSITVKTLHRTLSPTGNPELKSPRVLLRAIGMQLTVLLRKRVA